jgi:hypothetical protein
LADSTLQPSLRDAAKPQHAVNSVVPIASDYRRSAVIFTLPGLNGLGRMAGAPTAIADDEDLTAALEWFREIDGARGLLGERVRQAQAFFRSHAVRMDARWPDPGELLLKSDLIASYLAQADAFLHDPTSYNLTLAAHIVPFLKHIGAGVGLLRRMPGAEDRARRLLTPKQQHPDGVLFELSAAIRYAREDFEVEFVPESSTRSADFRVGPPGSTKDLHVECKRLRASEYELREQVSVRALIDSLATFIRESGRSLFVDVTFTEEVVKVPQSYLVDRIGSAVSSALWLPNGYPWRDEYSEGLVREARIDAVRADTRANGPLIYLHYYLPRVSEAHSWTIDETAEMGSRLDEPLLDDPRIFMLAELQPDATKAAWDLPPPQPLR